MKIRREGAAGWTGTLVTETRRRSADLTGPCFPISQKTLPRPITISLTTVGINSTFLRTSLSQCRVVQQTVYVWYHTTLKPIHVQHSHLTRHRARAIQLAPRMLASVRTAEFNSPAVVEI